MIREATGEAGDADAEEMFLYLGKFPDVESAFEKYNSTMDVNDTARVVCWDDPYDYCFRRRYISLLNNGTMFEIHPFPATTTPYPRSWVCARPSWSSSPSGT